MYNKDNIYIYIKNFLFLNNYLLRFVKLIRLIFDFLNSVSHLMMYNTYIFVDAIEVWP